MTVFPFSYCSFHVSQFNLAWITCCSMVWPHNSDTSMKYITAARKWASAVIACISMVLRSSSGWSSIPGVSITFPHNRQQTTRFYYHQITLLSFSPYSKMISKFLYWEGIYWTINHMRILNSQHAAILNWYPKCTLQLSCQKSSPKPLCSI